ncbi:MAG: hypothetical protein ABW136_09155 [Steroidobacteraceae bacterium]
MNDDHFEELDESQRALAARLRSTLRDSERSDPVSSTRLARARAAAMAAAGDRGSPRVLAWIWAPGSAAVAVLAALLFLQPGKPLGTSHDGVESNAADALEVMTDELDNDFYEDLEMYRWLEQDGNA